MITKRDIAVLLLATGQDMFVHLVPRGLDVDVPSQFKKNDMLILQVGHNVYPVPIPDLKVDSRGIEGTLTFSRAPFLCFVPWRAVYGLVGLDGRGRVWPEDGPVPHMPPVREASGPVRRGRPSLTLIQGGAARAPGRAALRPLKGGDNGPDVA